MSELNLILLGPPGAGKGTQADKLKDDFGLPYIGTGELLRKHKDEGTELGREAAKLHGQRRPRAGRARDPDDPRGDRGARARDGFLLDGYPRSVEQADALAEALEENGRSLTAALLIDVDDETVIQRLSGRRQCVKNGHLYHVMFDPPKHDEALRPGRHAAGPARRRQARDGQAAARDVPRQDRAADRLLRGARAAAALRRHRATPKEVHDHIRATLAMLRLEERL